MKESITKKEAIEYIEKNISQIDKKSRNTQLEFTVLAALAIFEDLELLTIEEFKDLSKLLDDTKYQKIRVIKGKFEGEEGVLDILSKRGPSSRAKAKVNLTYCGRVDVGWSCLEYYKDGVWTPNF